MIQISTQATICLSHGLGDGTCLQVVRGATEAFRGLASLRLLHIWPGPAEGGHRIRHVYKLQVRIGGWRIPGQTRFNRHTVPREPHMSTKGPNANSVSFYSTRPRELI